MQYAVAPYTHDSKQRNIFVKQTVVSTQSTSPLQLWPLMFERVACAMGMMAFVALAGPIGRLFGLAEWQIGMAVTVAALAWMLLARTWGRASDRHGRRPVILFGLAGFALSYALLCLFIDVALRWQFSALIAFFGLVLWRGLAGAFYAGVPPMTFALIADHVPAERRAGAMAMLGVASGVGVVIGPALAGLLAPYGLSLALYAIAPLPAMALVVLWFALPRAPGTASATKPAPKWTDARLRRPMMIAFVGMFSVSIAQITVGFYAIDRLGLDPAAGARVAGIALTCVGAALLLSQLLVRWLQWPPARLLRLGMAAAAVGFGAAAWADTAPLLWACYFVAAAGMGWVWPSVNALATSVVEPHEQGVAAGTVSSAQACGAIVGPLAGTLIYDVAIMAPYVLIALALAGMAAWGSGRQAAPGRGDELARDKPFTN